MLSKCHSSHRVYFALFLVGQHNLGVFVRLLLLNRGELSKMIDDVDDKLFYKAALEFSTQDHQQEHFINEVFTFYIRTYSSRSLAELGGKAVNMKNIPR